MTKCIFSAIFILYSAFLTVTAQDARKLSLADCIRIGITNSNTLKVSKSKVTSAGEKLSEVNASRLPSLKLSGGYSRLSKVDPFVIIFNGRKMNISPVLLNSTQARLTLNQPIFTGFRLDATADMNGALAKATEEDYKRDFNQLIFDIKNAFWSYFSANESLKSIDESIQQMKGHLTDVQNMFNSGLATKNDLLKTRVQLSNVELTKLDVENAVRLSMMALNNIIGLPVSTEVTIVTDVSFNERTLPSKDDYLLKALQERNELKAIELRIKAGEAGVTMSKSGWYPQLNFSANYLFADPNPRIMPSQDKFISTWDVNFTFSMDLWNWMTVSHQTAQAQATLEQSKYGFDQLKDAITLEVTQCYLVLKKLREKINFARETVTQAEENFRVSNEKFKVGAAINSDLLDAETLLLVSKINLSTALAEYELASAKLDKAIGKNIELMK